MILTVSSSTLGFARCNLIGRAWLFVHAGRSAGHADGPSRAKSAADIVTNDADEKLAEILYNFGEERASRRIARAIVEARRAITTTLAACGLIEKLSAAQETGAKRTLRHAVSRPADRGER